MGKLQQLREMVAEWFESADAQDKNTIDKLATVKQLVDDASTEQDALAAENKDLVSAYKNAIKHTSFSDPNVAPKDTIEPTTMSLEEALNEFIKKGEF